MKQNTKKYCKRNKELAKQNEVIYVEAAQNSKIIKNKKKLDK